MKRKEAVYKGLQFIDVWQTDSSLTSPEYFQITEFPTRLTAGKNLFKLRGHPTNLRVGGYLNVEILDYNGDPIYHEIVDYIDEDKSRVIAIYIYSDTSPGDCTITLLAEAVNVPEAWKGRPNIKWTRAVPVNPNVTNDSEIIFETLPTVTLTEEIGPHLDRIYSNGQFPTYSTGTVRYFLLNNQPAIEVIGGTLTSDMSSGTLTVTSPQNPTPTPIYTPATAQYRSTIKKILSPTTALLDTEYTVYSSQSISSHTYTRFDASTFSISYEATPVYVATQNSESYALIEITGLQPATGDISRIKTFMNNNGSVGTWELINDVELDETEIFVASTSSILPDVSIGTFVTQSTINTYWDGITYQGRTTATAPVLTWTTASISNAMQISSSVDISATNAVTIAKIKSNYAGVFTKGSSYKITFDALGTRIGNQNPKLSMYLSGSSFDFVTTDYFNQELPVRLGKRIGEIEVTTDNQRFDDYVFNFEADNTGTAVLIVVVESGLWQVADIRTTSDNDAGYTPDYTRLKSLVPTAHKINNQLSFKIEYYNVAGVKSKQINYVSNVDWEGGNRYVDGDYSMLTGSLYIANTLESGIALTGNNNTGFVRSLGYSGFDAGFPGFLMWSGSALPGQTSKGQPYSGVGLELYGDANNYFRYTTNPSELDVHTETFFFGDPNSQFISGSNGNLEISSSGFHLTADGNVTASSFIAVNGSNVLFNSNAEFVDGFNIGRVLYFDQSEYTYDISLLSGSAQSSTGSIFAGPTFQAFILPGETQLQVSYTYELVHDNATNAQRAFAIQTYILNAISGSNTGTSVYGKFNNSSNIGSISIAGGTVLAETTSSGAFTVALTDAEIPHRQGFYVLIHTTINASSTAGSPTGYIKLKNFVYRISRTVGGAVDNSAVANNPIE